VKVAGRWRYVYRPFDQLGQIIDVLALLGCVDPGQSEGQYPLGSDRQDQFVECDRHPPVGGLGNRQLVVSAAKVLHEGVSGDDHPGPAVLFEAAHGRSRAFSLPWSHSTRLLAYRSVRCQAAGSRSSNTAGYTGA